jgi:hypothetical protein
VGIEGIGLLLGSAVLDGTALLLDSDLGIDLDFDTTEDAGVSTPPE